MKYTSKIMKAGGVLFLAGFMMGNTQCELAPHRQLKKNIRLIQLNASTFLDNSGFSFSEVARSQFSGVIFEKNDFFERSIYPTLDQLNGRSDQQFFGVQKTAVDSKTVSQLKTWFPTMKSQEILLNRESSCFMTRPQHFVIGKINSIEAYGGGELQFGFNQSVVQVPISAHIKIDRMRMDLSFHGLDPWTQQVSASVNSEAIKNDYKIGFGVDLGVFHIGPEFYRVTGMAETVLKALKNGTTDLAKKLLGMPRQEWSTRIIYSRDNYVAILGGAELGLKKGDKLKVFNEVHTWIGEPCGESSVLAGSMIVSDVKEPWIIEIEDAGNLMSHAKVLNIKEDESISTGALVQLHQFVAETPSEKPVTK